MHKFNRSGLWMLLLAAFLGYQSAAQIPASIAHPGAAPVSTAPAPPKDPRGRATPQSSILNFVKYAQHGDYETASKYLQLPLSNKIQQNEEYAQQLLILINTSFRGSLATISDSPEGDLTDADNPNVDIVGKFVVDDQELQLQMVKVVHPDTGPIWLVSQQTLQQVPNLYQGVGAPRLARYFPDVLTKHSFGGVPDAQWLAWLLTIPLSWAAAWATVWLVRRLWAMRKRPLTVVPYKTTSNTPFILFLAIEFNAVLVLLIGLPLYYRVYYFRLLGVVLTITLAWLSARAANRIYERITFSSFKRESRSLLQLAHRLYKVAILIVAILIIITLLGFNAGTMLAGLGIGGIALALAAQKSLEGILGGITLVMDKTASAGDECVLSGRYVTVKEIGLRSLRVTTREGTEMTFPNGMVAQGAIENLSRREKFLISSSLRLSYECSLAQLQLVIASIREVLYSHARIEQKNASVRLSGIGADGYRIDLFAYVDTVNGVEFGAIQEDILFRAIEIVESSGATWAIPSQITYLTQERVTDEVKVAESEQIVKNWQDTQQVPFPDFSPDHIAEVRGKLAYPAANSVLRKPPSEGNERN